MPKQSPGSPSGSSGCVSLPVSRCNTPEKTAGPVFPTQEAVNDGCIQIQSASRVISNQSIPNHRHSAECVTLNRCNEFNIDQVPLKLNKFVTFDVPESTEGSCETIPAEEEGNQPLPSTNLSRKPRFPWFSKRSGHLPVVVEDIPKRSPAVDVVRTVVGMPSADGMSGGDGSLSPSGPPIQETKLSRIGSLRQPLRPVKRAETFSTSDLNSVHE